MAVVSLTIGGVLWEAEQGQVSIVAVGSIVVEIGGKVCLCWGQKHEPTMQCLAEYIFM